jgi:hypothetical protein
MASRASRDDPYKRQKRCSVMTRAEAVHCAISVPLDVTKLRGKIGSVIRPLGF